MFKKPPQNDFWLILHIIANSQFPHKSKTIHSYKKFNLQTIESWKKLRAYKNQKLQKKRQNKSVTIQKNLIELKEYETINSRVTKKFIESQKLESCKTLRATNIWNTYPKFDFRLIEFSVFTSINEIPHHNHVTKPPLKAKPFTAAIIGSTCSKGLFSWASDKNTSYLWISLEFL